MISVQKLYFLIPLADNIAELLNYYFLCVHGLEGNVSRIKKNKVVDLINKINIKFYKKKTFFIRVNIEKYII